MGSVTETKSYHSPRLPVTLEKQQRVYMSLLSEFLSSLARETPWKTGRASLVHTTTLGPQQKALCGPNLKELTGLKEQGNQCLWGGVLSTGMSLVRIPGYKD